LQQLHHLHHLNVAMHYGSDPKRPTHNLMDYRKRQQTT
jgi:hypothetical protein